MNIAELVAQLRAEATDCRSRMAHFAEGMRQAEAEAEMLELVIERIEITDEAKSATSLPADAANGADITPHPRKPRRDIRALVRTAISNGAHSGGWSHDERVRHLSKDLGCRPSLIEAALRAIVPEEVEFARGSE